MLTRSQFLGERMIKIFLNLLLALIVVTCPMRCQLLGGECGCSADTTLQLSDCGCKKSSNVPDSDCPAKSPDGEPASCSQCICSGATVADYFVWGLEIPSQPLFLGVLPMFEPGRILSDHKCRPPDGYSSATLSGYVNVGKAKRILECSLTI